MEVTGIYTYAEGRAVVAVDYSRCRVRGMQYMQYTHSSGTYRLTNLGKIIPSGHRDKLAELHNSTFTEHRLGKFIYIYESRM